jgi:hypothetical protein
MMIPPPDKRNWNQYRFWIILLGFFLILSAACTAPVLAPNADGNQELISAEFANLSLTQTSVALEATRKEAHPVAPLVASTPDLEATLSVSEATLDAAHLTETEVPVVPSPTQTQAPTLTTTQQALPGFSNFIDNFTDPNSGWPEDKTGVNQWWYANDHYHINVETANTQVVIPSGYILEDSYVITYGLIPDQTSPPQAFFGIVCRYQDINNYYFFEISTDGFYRIGKMWNGQWSLIGMGVAKFSTAIQMNDYNQLMVHCWRNELSLTVNDIFVETVYDNTFNSGEIGLCASAGQVPGMIAAFQYIMAEE